MKQLSVVIVLVLLIIHGLAFGEETFCVTFDVSKTSRASASCNCHNYTDWSALTSNSSRYFKSYTKICFLLGTFNLSTKLIINNVTNISIIGTDSVKPTSIKCFNNSFLVINNSEFVEIQNLKLETCGASVQRYIEVQDMQAYTALLLLNVRSVAIYNIAYKNSYGHSIIGINLIGSSVFQQVTVFYTNDSSVHKVRMGGIILMFTDELTNHSNYGIRQNILIKHYQVYYMNNTRARNQQYRNLKKLLCALAFGFSFHQQKYSVSIKILNTNVSNINAQYGSLVYILHNSNNTNNISFLNSVFSSNNISTSSIIEIYQYTELLRRPCRLASVFESVNNTLSYNTAQSIYYITQTSHPYQMMIHIKTILTVFSHNQVEHTFWKLRSAGSTSYPIMINVTVKQCTFIFNRNFMLEFYNVKNVMLLGKNLFANNSINIKQPKALIKCKETELMFEGYNEFSCNTAYWILELSTFVILRESAIINITQNIAVTLKDREDKTSSALIHFADNNKYHLCMFQFYSSQKLQRKILYMSISDYFSVLFKDNKNFSTLTYGTQLNSCFWLNGMVNFGNLTTGEVMRSILHFSNNTSEQIVCRKICTLCYCDGRISKDCINDRFGPIYAGQNIPINLKQIPPYSNTTSIYSIAQPLKQLHGIEQCTVKPDQLNWLLSINKSCTPISYKIYSKFLHQQCYVAFKTTYPDDSLYIYYININRKCPLGFNLIDESCECHAKLKATFPSIVCDINTQTFNHFGESWIGLSAQGNVIYVKVCAPTVCKKEPSSIHLNSSNSQCNFNRGGVACGECPSELSAVFGSLRCKRCSNQWLFLIPVFLVAGLLLVILLFALNITVVDGKINGFIFYVNVIIVNIHGLFSSPSALTKVMSLMNLDLGIETCFYHGMSEYDKTWLEFAFPFYLLLIVAMLALASRYCSSVERLTRRRVIPVIATIFLLTYSKLLIVSAKVLFSFTTVYSLSDNTKTGVWMWDTSIPLFGIKIAILFIATLLLVLVILLPINFFLLFTKLVLRIRFLAKYLKPYLDAFQAPFKDSCRYFPGLELVLRWMSFAVGSMFLTTGHERLALDNFICVLLLAYLCALKPFKSLANTVLYITYVINIECIIVLQIYSDLNIKKCYYTMIFHILIFIALGEFAAMLLYYLYINQLQKIKSIKLLATKMNKICSNWYKRFKFTPAMSPNIEPIGDYEQLQEELLLADPAQ